MRPTTVPCAHDGLYFKCLRVLRAPRPRRSEGSPRPSIYGSLHDNSITQATLAFLKGQKKVAAVMGGHDEPRDSQTYAAVARMARALPAARLLEELFTRNNRGPDYKKDVLVTGDEKEAIDFLVANAPPANSHLRRLKSLGLLS